MSRTIMQFCLNSVVSYYDRFGLDLWAIDGTGNHREIQETNVARFANLYRDGEVHYLGGVGNAIDYPWWRIVERKAGEAFGYGAIGKKNECVKGICDYYCSVQRKAYNSVVVRMDGIHSDIGGFYDNGIANRSLINMVSSAQAAGVKIDLPPPMNNPSYVPSSNKENGNFSWWWTLWGTRTFDPSIMVIK